MLLNAPFERLPAEIVEAILSQPSLCSEDVRSIRLVSKAFADICTWYLFRQVHISALHQDRETFLHVAQSPHLACHVQTLVWEELTGNFDLLSNDDSRRSAAWSTYSRPKDEYDTLADIAAQVKPLFWLMPEHIARDENGAMKTCDSLRFWSEFIDAVDKFPALQSFESRPMHPDRQLQSATDGYPLTARSVSGFLHFNDWNMAFNDPNATVFNMGFLLYIVPLLKLYTERGDQRQKQLCFTDESITKYTALEHLTAIDAPAFRHINHLELRICENLKQRPRDITGLSACLAGAFNLTHFHVRYLQNKEWKETPLDPRNIHISPLLELPILPALHTLCLEDVVLECTCDDAIEFNPMAPLDHEQLAVVDFVERHAGTLKKLYILSSSVTEQTVRELARVPTLKLERFVMVPPDREVDTCAVDESDLLKFINGKNNSDVKGSKSSDASPPSLTPFWAPPSTHGRVRAWQDWAAETNTKLQQNNAWVDTDPEDDEARGMNIDVHEPAWEICRTYDSESGLWIDNDGMYYDPKTDQELRKPTTKSPPPETNDWKIQNHREWDIKFGLWRNPAPTSLHKFAHDRPINNNPDNLGPQGENDPNLQPNTYIVSEIPSYHSETCHGENFEHHSRVLTSKTWCFGRDASNTLYYWEVLRGKGQGHDTELWHFIHRNGEEAYGSDPLTFWADWEGTAAGDVASSLPYGWRLWLLYTNTRISETLQNQLPRPEEIGTIYGEPVIYDVDSDPMRDWKSVRAEVPPPRRFSMDDYEVCVGDMRRAAMAERDGMQLW